jgi:hypothetical protein
LTPWKIGGINILGLDVGEIRYLRRISVANQKLITLMIKLSIKMGQDLYEYQRQRNKEQFIGLGMKRRFKEVS